MTSGRLRGGATRAAGSDAVGSPINDAAPIALKTTAARETRRSTPSIKPDDQGDRSPVVHDKSVTSSTPPRNHCHRLQARPFLNDGSQARDFSRSVAREHCKDAQL